MKYVKRAVVVDAIQYSGENFDEIAQAFNVANFKRDLGDYLFIPTLEGEMRANPGDYIVRGVEGELYPVKPEIFAKTFDKIEESDVILYTDGVELAKKELSKLDKLAAQGIVPPLDRSKFGKTMKELANEQLAKVRENNARLEQEENNE